MRKIFAVAALLILTGSMFAQTKWAAEDMGKLMYAQCVDNGEQYTERKGAVKNTAHQYYDE